MFSVLTQDLGCHEFKDNREVRRIWLLCITHGTDNFQQKGKSSSHCITNVSVMLNTMWKSSDREAQLNLNCYYEA